MKKIFFTRRKLKKYCYRSAFVLILFYVLNDFSKCDCEGVPEKGILSLNSLTILGSWVLKTAEFRQEVDLDGAGPMLPISDAKAIFYGIFDMYGSCSSIDDIPIQFTTLPGKVKSKTVNVDCPPGFGVVSWMCDYAYERFDNPTPWIYLQREEIIDPAKLFEWRGFITLHIRAEDTLDNKYSISGFVPNLISSLPEPKPDLTFDFVLEKVD